MERSTCKFTHSLLEHDADSAAGGSFARNRAPGAEPGAADGARSTWRKAQEFPDFGTRDNMAQRKPEKEALALAANTIRVISAEAVEKAKSGHPGMPMGMAELGATLWLKFL